MRQTDVDTTNFVQWADSVTKLKQWQPAVCLTIRLYEELSAIVSIH